MFNDSRHTLSLAGQRSLACETSTRFSPNGSEWLTFRRGCLCSAHWGVPFVVPTFLEMEEATIQPLPPVRVLQKMYGRLFQAISSPDLLAGFMYSEGLIGDETVVDVSSTALSQAKTKLLTAFSATLRVSERQENVMERMCKALQATGEPVLREIASDIRSLCRGLFVMGRCVFADTLRSFTYRKS